MAITLVQAKHLNMVSVGATAVVLAFDANVTAGNLIDVWATWGNATNEAPTSCADALGNTFTEIAACRSAIVYHGQIVAAFYKENIVGGACTITLTLPGSRTYRSLTISEWSGAETTAALDKSGVQYQAATTAPASPSVTTVSDGQVVISSTENVSTGVGAITLESSSVSNTGATDGCATQYEIQTSAGAIAGNFTLATARDMYTSIRTYKAGATAAGGPRTPLNLKGGMHEMLGGMQG